MNIKISWYKRRRVTSFFLHSYKLKNINTIYDKISDLSSLKSTYVIYGTNNKSVFWLNN